MKHMAMLQHEQMLAQQAEQGPPPDPRVKRSVVLKGNLTPQETARMAGDAGNGGPHPAGARAGGAVSLTPASGMGPARAMASAPGGP
jgi:hypothetical protein